MKGAKDMTKGNPFALLFGFAFSLMIGNVFQQLYTFVDTMIVGNYLGVTALAALGATEWLVFVMFGCAFPFAAISPLIFSLWQALRRRLRLAFGGCVFVFLPVVGVQTAV